MSDDTFYRCERGCLKRFLSVSGLASHARAHGREDGRMVAEIANRAATAVRRYERIDDLAGAVAYQVREVSRLGMFYGLPASELCHAERIAVGKIKLYPVTDAAKAAVIAHDDDRSKILGALADGQIAAAKAVR